MLSSRKEPNVACKRCEERLRDLVKLEAHMRDVQKLLNFERQKSRELQEACNRYKEEGRASWVALQKELVKPSVEELLKTASAAAQIAVLARKSLPVSRVVDEAESAAGQAGGCRGC